MEKFRAAYLPIGVPTFHMESAREQFEASAKMLKELDEQLFCPSDIILSVEALRNVLDEVSPDLVILQNVTFANAAYTQQVLRQCDCPVLLWTLREPVIDGGRLRLNSLTGAYSAANTMKNMDRRFNYVFGAPGEPEVRRQIMAVILAAKAWKNMSRMKVAAIGHPPEGFGFGQALDVELLKNFGVGYEAVEVRQLIRAAEECPESSIQTILDQFRENSEGLEKIPEKNQRDFARLLYSYQKYVTEHHIGAIASRCWPDLFTEYGTPVCAVLSLLNDLGTAASCEGDVYGALSMYIGMQLTGRSAFFGDPVSLDERENTVTYWHCGMAPCSLADGKACIGVHPNRKLGPVMDFGCGPCDKVTIFRIGRNPDGTFRFFLTSGEALEKPKQFNGTSVVVRTDAPAKDLVCRSVEDGWEPHFVVIYGDVALELEALSRIAGIELIRY